MKRWISLLAVLTCLLTLFAMPLSAASVAEMNRLFESKLSFLDQYYTLGADFMSMTMSDVLYPYEEGEANGWKLKKVSEKEYEDTLNLYFAPTAKDIADLRQMMVHDIELGEMVPCYDADAKCYYVGCWGGFGGAMPERDYQGYVIKGDKYEVFFQHVTYEFLDNIVPANDPFWAQVEADEWPEKVTYKGIEYQNGPDGYCRVLSKDDYGNRYELTYKNGIVRILSQQAYTKKDLPASFATDPVTTTTKPTTTTTKKPTTTTKKPTTTTKQPTGGTTVGTTTTGAVTTTNGSTTVGDTTTGDITTTTSATTAPQVFEVVAQIPSATVEAAPDTFPQNTEVKIESVTSDSLAAPMQNALKEQVKAFVAYEITAMSNNVTVQPNGKVKATFTVPADYDMDRVAVLYVSPDGNTERIPSTLDRAGNKITAELTHFSTYVVAEVEETVTDTPDGTPETDKESDTTTIGAIEDDETDGFPWVIVIIVLAVLLLGGAAVLCFFVFRKK